MINFKQIAKSQTIVSDIMENRNKVEKQDGTVHISDFDFVNGNRGEYVVCAISNTEFINGGMVLTKIFKACVDAYGGDLTSAREDFRSQGGMDVKLTRARTRDGNAITRVEVL